MNVQTAKYVVNPFSGETNVINVTLAESDVMLSIPVDDSNADYQEIMRQVEAGELTIASADAQADNS